jgi:hypothetical protein
MPDFLRGLLEDATDAAAVRRVFADIDVPTSDLSDEHIMVVKEVLQNGNSRAARRQWSEDIAILDKMEEALINDGYKVTYVAPRDRHFYFYMPGQRATHCRLESAYHVLSHVDPVKTEHEKFLISTIFRPSKTFNLELIDCPSGVFCPPGRKRPYCPRECKEEEKKRKVSRIE